MRSLRSAAALGLVLLMVFLTTPGFSSEPATVRIANATFSENVAALWIGADMGFFKKHEANVEVLQIRTGPLIMAAMASGDLQMAYTAPGPVLSAKASGMDVAFFAGIVNRADGEIVSSLVIKRPQDLKGKRLGVQSIGGGAWSKAMVGLESLGLEPTRDKILVQVVGDFPVLVQALVSNNIDAAYLSYAFANDTKKKGFHSLVDLGRTGVPYQGVALAARRAYLSANRDTVDAVLRGILEAVVFIKNPANKAAVIQALMKHLHLAQPADAELGYQVLQVLLDYDIRPSPAGIRTIYRLMVPVNPQLQSIKPEDVIDDGPIQRLEKSGFLGAVSKTSKRDQK